MTEALEQILLQLTQSDNASIQQATAQLEQAFKDPAIIPALCAVMSGSQNPQIRQSAAVRLRMRVKKHWKKIIPNDRESLKAMVLQAFMQETEHTVEHSLSQLCAVMVKHETPDRWPALMEFLNQSTKSSNPHERQVGLMLLSKVMESNPETFKSHYCQLLQLFSTVLQDHNNPTALYYCILALTAITAHTGSEEMIQMRSIIPSLIVALKHRIKSDQGQASEAMEVFYKLMESEVSIVVPHVSEIVRFCLEVGSDTTLSDSLRVKALSCITLLIKLESKTVLNQKRLYFILLTIFPVLIAAPPPGEHDPEDVEDDNGDGIDNNKPKNCAAQIIDTMADHIPPEKLFQQLMLFAKTCLASENPYERKGRLTCLAVLAKGCADHLHTKLLSKMLKTVCQSLSDTDQVVRSAGLLALEQFSKHLQPEVSKYCAELMPLLLGYLSSSNQTKGGHVTKAFYTLKNFINNLGADIEPYLPTLMEAMLSALNNTENLKLKELVVSAIGDIAKYAKKLQVPYLPPVIESLMGFLTTTTEEMRSLQTQSLETLSVLARTIGKDVLTRLADCVQLALNLTNTINDPYLRRCTYGLYSAVSKINPDCLTPHLPAITTVILLALKSNEGITDHIKEDKKCALLDDDGDDNETQKDTDEFLEDKQDSEIHGVSEESAFIMEFACGALAEIAFNTGTAFQPFLEHCFLWLNKMRDFSHEGVRRAAFMTMGQFCRAQHKAWKDNPTEANHQSLLKWLDIVLPCFVEIVRTEHKRKVVIVVLKAMNLVIESCKGEAFRSPLRLMEISHVVRDVLEKKTVCQDGGGDEAADEDQQAADEGFIQLYARMGISLLASSVPADNFAPFLNDLLPRIMIKAKSTCKLNDRLLSLTTIGDILTCLTSVSGGQEVAGQLSNRLLPVLVAQVRDSNVSVCNESIYALGCLVQATGPICLSDYPMMLSEFSNMLTEETDLWVIVNLCEVLYRMIMNNVDAVHLEQIVPVLGACLNRNMVLLENEAVVNCLAMLYTKTPALVVQLMKPIVAASSLVLGKRNVGEETQNILVMLIKQFALQHSADFQKALTSLPGEQQAKLSAAISAS